MKGSAGSAFGEHQIKLTEHQAPILTPFSGLIKQSLDLPYLLQNTGVIATLLIGSALLSLLAGALTSGLSARRLTKSKTGLILREDA